MESTEAPQPQPKTIDERTGDAVNHTRLEIGKFLRKTEAGRDPPVIGFINRINRERFQNRPQILIDAYRQLGIDQARVLAGEGKYMDAAKTIEDFIAVNGQHLKLDLVKTPNYLVDSCLNDHGPERKEDHGVLRTANMLEARANYWEDLYCLKSGGGNQVREARVQAIRDLAQQAKQNNRAMLIMDDFVRPGLPDLEEQYYGDLVHELNCWLLSAAPARFTECQKGDWRVLLRGQQQYVDAIDSYMLPEYS
jgi:hypothetical protein